MKAKITTTSGVKLNIYQIISAAEEDDKIILHGDIYGNEPMLIGFDNLPGTPISAGILTLYRPMIAEFKIS